jgi:mono/diheme cytochrome c family protein
MTRLSPLIFALLPTLAQAQDIDHGRYLVTIMGCTDCHTPGHFLGQPDMARFLGGSDVGFEIPGLGTFHGPNLTPDPTGLGGWSEAEIATAIRTGVRPDGRQLAPAMPWMNYAALTDRDAADIAAFLKTLSPVANDVPGPFAPGEATDNFVLRVVPPGP